MQSRFRNKKNIANQFRNNHRKRNPIPEKETHSANEFRLFTNGLNLLVNKINPLTNKINSLANKFRLLAESFEASAFLLEQTSECFPLSCLILCNAQSLFLSQY